jgi:hypothetical protein
MPTMATTIISSISVKPRCRRWRMRCMSNVLAGVGRAGVARPETRTGRVCGPSDRA